jgi:hypothetical protein
MKSTLVNELYQVVQRKVQAEQLVHLTVSKDMVGGGIVGTYQQSGAMLSAVQNFAQRFPQLQEGGAFQRVGSPKPIPWRSGPLGSPGPAPVTSRSVRDNLPA